MATYDPPQPMWKRNLAGILDFFLAFFVCVYGVSEIFGNRSDTTRNLRLRGGIDPPGHRQRRTGRRRAREAAPPSTSGTAHTLRSCSRPHAGDPASRYPNPHTLCR